MHYAIITNPAAGRMSADQKRSVLAPAAKILGAEIRGLDTATAEDLGQCARHLASRCDVLAVAGGDGTFSDIINAVDTARTAVAFLPLGSGNAMQYALNYKGTLADIAMRIRDGKIHEYDLIDCDGKCRAFMASIGLDGLIIRFREQYVAQGVGGFKAYFKAVLKAYFRQYQRTHAFITIDDRTLEVKNLLSLMIVKHPYYGYGMNVVPGARFNDRRLHICCLNSGLLPSFIGGITAFAGGNRTGQFYTGRRLAVTLKQPLVLQYNGNAGWDADAFGFTVLPNVLKIKC